MPKLIQVHFRKSPTGAPFKLAYHKGDFGFVRPQMARALLEAGMIDPVNLVETPDIEYTPSAKIEKPKAKTDPDLSTKEAVAAVFRDDVEALRAYCDEQGIKYGTAAKRPEYFWAQIAKHHKSK